MAWPGADAEARFSELLDAAEKEGPHFVSRHGIETAVVVPIAEWKRLNASLQRDMIDPLTDANGPHDIEIPVFSNFKLHPATLED